ncbi:MAG: preprotein translocase subunit SecA, partial [Bacteroidota bacterium]
MIKAIQGILKKFVGDKAQNDLKAIQPIVEAILQEEQKLASLHLDELRGISQQLKNDIALRLAPNQSKIDALKEKAEQLSMEELEQKESIYLEVDALEKENLELLQQQLDEILPRAFALVKETAKRFTAQPTLEVTATDFDKALAAQGKDFVSIQGDKAIWKNSWNAA